VTANYEIENSESFFRNLEFWNRNMQEQI
jgi:hypothetical protein